MDQVRERYLVSHSAVPLGRPHKGMVARYMKVENLSILLSLKQLTGTELNGRLKLNWMIFVQS